MERHVGGTGDSWAEDVATAWRARLAASPSARMCLATGSTPLPVYERMSRSPDVFGRASVLLLDEFGDLPPADPASCDRVLRANLIDRIDLTDYRPIDADAADVDAECADVDAWIDAGPGGMLDLAVLGLGRNGHLGLNEPGTMTNGRTARVDLADTNIAGARRSFGGRAAPSWGVTDGLRDLLAAREVWVLATGSAKAAIVERCFRDRPSVDVPASLLQAHPNCIWWLDETAAG